MKEVLVRGRGKPYGQWHVQQGNLIIRIDDDENAELWFSVCLPIGDVLADAVKPEAAGRPATPALQMLGAIDAHIEDNYGLTWLDLLLSTFNALRQNAHDIDPEATAECVASCEALAEAIRNYSNALRAASEAK